MNSTLSSEFRSVLRRTARLLTFKANQEELLGLRGHHFAFGLFCTWIVGMGRSWDDPHANSLQSLGVGSLIYVFVLAFLLWSSVRPLAPMKLGYIQVLAFVCMVSPPGILYAIPVEKFVAPKIAGALNVTLLCIVASWRVALLVFYLRRGISLSRGEVTIATLFPLATILAPITFFGLMEEVMSAMSGLRDSQEMSDPAKTVVYCIGILSVLLWLPLALIMVSRVGERQRERELAARPDKAE